MPDLLPEHPAQAGEPHAVGQFDHTAVDIAFGQAAVPKEVPSFGDVVVVVAVDQPNPIDDGFKLLVQRSLCFHVTQQDDR